MFVIQTKTGCEKEAAAALINKGYDIRIPEKMMNIRRQGRFIYQQYLIFSGYIFMNADDIPPNVYYDVKNSAGVINFLGRGKPTPLTETEKRYINILWNGGMPILPSKVYKTVTGALMVMSGILKKYPMEIVKADIRHKRAKVEIPICGTIKKITLPIEVL